MIWEDEMERARKLNPGMDLDDFDIDNETIQKIKQSYLPQSLIDTKPYPNLPKAWAQWLTEGEFIQGQILNVEDSRDQNRREGKAPDLEEPINKFWIEEIKFLLIWAFLFAMVPFELLSVLKMIGGLAIPSELINGAFLLGLYFLLMGTYGSLKKWHWDIRNIEKRV